MEAIVCYSFLTYSVKLTEIEKKPYMDFLNARFSSQLHLSH
ncbi:hypothetical protein HMPREF6485_2144 [Segatella buccae ATCC 33574]|uniref:Uncharacterized protein n=1 Tax=Segatella buccae ATCC 33574 TaxID=873513 RepID=E6K958_9BACT|nr:hypothetical protein HMPREF6485_2144 [Segatella buccae ATCC 33574]